MNKTTQLLQLLTLSSANLPIGAYCYSQGVESAIETGLITDEKSCLDFLTDTLELVIKQYELPMLKQMLAALQAEDDTRFLELAEQYLASRETNELLLETTQIAHAFNAWLRDVLNKDTILEQNYGFLPLFAKLVQILDISTEDTLTAYGFTQLENLVLAAVKTVPLGQMAGQRILWQLQTDLAKVVAEVMDNRVHINASMPNLAILSSLHETQYSRLFRS